MAIIRIRFITEHDVISQAIDDVTWGPFSHMDFVLDDGTMLGAHAKDGVQIRQADYCKPSNEEWYSIVRTDIEKAETLAFAYSQIGKPYDFADIAGILTHRDWRCENSWICSELVTAAFEKGRPMLHVPGDKFNRITPMMAYLSPDLNGNRLFPLPVLPGEPHDV